MTLVIAHRGASGYRPEHTLEAYQLAVALGADFVEPDLVSTKDGVLVARHENEISATTDVAHHPELADRRTTKTVDGRSVTGWFTEDLTLAELQTLHARERLPQLRPESSRHDGRHQVPTIDEIIDLVALEGRRRGRVVGVYPEIKSPSYFRSIGLPLEEPLVRALRGHQLDRYDSAAYVQCFEPSALRRLAETSAARLVQLIAPGGAPYDLASRGDSVTYADLVRPAGLREVSTYAIAIGAHKDVLMSRHETGSLRGPTSVTVDAHRAGLLVHAWTFRDEERFLPTGYDAFAEYAAYFDAGVDGVFTDFTDTAVAARAAHLEAAAPTAVKDGVAAMR